MAWPAAHSGQSRGGRQGNQKTTLELKQNPLGRSRRSNSRTGETKKVPPLLLRNACRHLPWPPVTAYCYPFPRLEVRMRPYLPACLSPGRLRVGVCAHSCCLPASRLVMMRVRPFYPIGFPPASPGGTLRPKRAEPKRGLHHMPTGGGRRCVFRAGGLRDSRQRQQPGGPHDVSRKAASPARQGRTVVGGGGECWGAEAGAILIPLWAAVGTDPV